VNGLSQCGGRLGCGSGALVHRVGSVLAPSRARMPGWRVSRARSSGPGPVAGPRPAARGPEHFYRVVGIWVTRVGGWPNRLTCATRTLHAISSRSRLRMMSGSPRRQQRKIVEVTVTRCPCSQLRTSWGAVAGLIRASRSTWLPNLRESGAVAPNRLAVRSLTTGIPESPWKKSGSRCRIGAQVFVAGVSGRPRGAPRTTGDDPRCSTWFP